MGDHSLHPTDLQRLFLLLVPSLFCSITFPLSLTPSSSTKSRLMSSPADLRKIKGRNGVVRWREICREIPACLLDKNLGILPPLLELCMRSCKLSAV